MCCLIHPEKVEICDSFISVSLHSLTVTLNRFPISLTLGGFALDLPHFVNASQNSSPTSSKTTVTFECCLHVFIYQVMV